MAENLGKRPSKGILKSSSSFDSQEAPSRASKETKWDEMNIIATLHPADKDYGHMKIDEPKTPYNYEGVDNEHERDQLDSSIIAAKLAGNDKPKILEESSEEEDEETPEERPVKVPKYTQISLAEKYKILQRLEAGETNGRIAKDYGVTHSTVSYIKKTRENICAQLGVLQEQQGNYQKTRVTATETSAFEQGMYKWFCQKRSSGESVSGPMLRKQALVYNEKLGGPSNFRASNGWMQKFKSRHGIRDLATKGEKFSGNVDATPTFVTEFNRLITEGGYDLDNVYNADETGLTWNSLPSKIGETVETNFAGREMLKDRLTVMVCANAAGTHRIPLLLIGRSSKPECLKNVKTMLVHCRGHRNGWIDREIFIDWYTRIFLPSIKQKASGRNNKFLLLLDNAPSHPTAEELNSIDEFCTVVFLPQNVLALFQPMNQGVIESLKKNYKRAFIRQLLLTQESGECDAKTSFLKNWTLISCCDSIGQAWDLLSDEILRSAWKNIIFANTVIKVDPDAEDEIDLTYLLNRVSGYEHFTEEETQAWLEEDALLPVCRMLDDNELLGLSPPMEESMPNESKDSLQNVIGNDGEDRGELPTPHEVLKGLDTVLRWYRTRWESQPEDFPPLYKIRRVVEDVIFNS